MIELDDPIWKELWHCYGDGTDVPPKIKHIETSKTLSEEFWDDFSNTLCHQCTIGTASIAAFPHLVRIADQHLEDRKAFDSLRLASTILTFTLGPENKMPRVMPRGKTPQLDKVLREPFLQAIADGKKVLSEMLSQKRRTFTDTMLFLSMVAAFDLRADAANLLANLCLGWYNCPHCEDRIETDELCTW